MERWAAGDGNASEAFNKHEAIELWEAHARNPQVAIYRRNMILRRVGIYHGNDEDDDDISQCTEFLTAFTIADAGHTTYDLDPVPLWLHQLMLQCTSIAFWPTKSLEKVTRYLP